MHSEIIFDRRMKRRDKLIAQTAKKYRDLYERDDNLNELYKLHDNGIDTDYIDEFLQKLRDEIIAQLS